ncbi:MAG: VanZ family protein [Ruminococcus flavefaciens]|nr:VanZ family protein [Ruminococcus flavefaciens]MCM1229028.1 VanZ family protein [Ruminococcus flavefaciens]
MKKLKKSQIIFAVLTVVIMVCIFMFSCENSDESSETSGNFVKIIINILYSDFNDMTESEQNGIYSSISHIIRKTAHFSVYTALGLFSSLTVGRKKLISHRSAGVILFCFLYACSDELHQYFVPGRACMFTDVLIDTCGSITGLIISAVILKITAKKYAVPK